MFNTKRKRAVVLALIAFFCGATAVVGVDWKRFGGGFLAFFKPKSEPVPAYASGGGTPSGGGILTASAGSHPDAGPQLQPAAPATTQRRTSSVGGSGSHKSENDLFKYGDPAAGGIPPGSFVVAQNDTPGGGGNAGAPAPAPVGGLSAPDTAATAPSGGDTGGSGVTSPAPSPSGGSGDGGIVVKTPAPSPATPTPSPAPPPVVSPPTPSTPSPSPAPAPTPTQSGTSDQDPGNGGGDTPPPPPPVVVPPPVSAVPEASNAAMMGLGALFLAVAATRRRRNGQA